ncbi:MAG: hypothetical protein P4N59_13130 [Negativicutes bacterium]|nr:hypothetical protein [Negativicutes bacterium]
MSDELMRSLTSIAVAIVGLAVLAVIVSKNANTSAVIQASGSAFSNAIATAQSPVTGNKVSIDTSYPTSGFSLNNATIGE